jgi:hypothetical protein
MFPPFFRSSKFFIFLVLSHFCISDALSQPRYEAHWGPGQCKSCKCWVDGVKLSNNASFNECGNILIRWVIKNRPEEKITSEPELTDKTLMFGGKLFRVIELATCEGDC